MTRRGLTIRFLAVAVPALATPVLAQTISLTAAPTSLKFTYQAGAALPSAQTLSIRATGGTPTFNVTVTDPANPAQTPLWLTVTPESGKTPASLSVRVNPTGMAVGVYGAVINVQVPGGPLAAVPVSLTVSQPLPTLNLSKTTVSITAPPLTATDTVTLTTTAGPVSFTASAAGVSWLSISPVSGYVLPGAPITLTLSVDASLLSPQTTPYVGKVTVVASGVLPANRSQTITVNLTVNSAPPTITAALWPNSAQVGSPATTVTIRGTGFYKATTVKITPQGSTTATTVTPTVLSGTAMMAVIPASLLNTAQVLNVVASNPGGDSSPATFTVSSTPVVQAAVNLASYAVGPVSPGELITLFGEGIGPITDAFMADADADGFVDTSLNGISVTIDGKDAPMIYVSHDQISVQVPYEVTTGTGKTINVTNGATVATGTVDIAAASPGIFTLDTSGIGQAAALNYVASTATYTINSANNPARIGDTVILYITGEGDFATSLTPRTGLLIPPTLTPLPQLNPLPVVTIGGANASVAYAGPFVGSILGITQLNVVVPSGSTTGPAVPVSVTIGGATTQSGVTLSIHP
jgi:uncharacterized protein (TIGR03437 family)